MIFAIVACVALILGYVYYKVKTNTVPFKAPPVVAPTSTVAAATTPQSAQPSGASPMSKQLPPNFPADRIPWTERQWQNAIDAAKAALDAEVAKLKAAGKYDGPGSVGDVHSVWAGLVANHKTIQEAGLIPAG